MGFRFDERTKVIVHFLRIGSKQPTPRRRLIFPPPLLLGHRRGPENVYFRSPGIIEQNNLPTDKDGSIECGNHNPGIQARTGGWKPPALFQEKITLTKHSYFSLVQWPGKFTYTQLPFARPDVVLICLMPNTILGRHNGEVLLQEDQDGCDSWWSKSSQNTTRNVGEFDWFLGVIMAITPKHVACITQSKPASNAERFWEDEGRRTIWLSVEQISLN